MGYAQAGADDVRGARRQSNLVLFDFQSRGVGRLHDAFQWKYCVREKIGGERNYAGQQNRLELSGASGHGGPHGFSPRDRSSAHYAEREPRQTDDYSKGERKSGKGTDAPNRAPGEGPRPVPSRPHDGGWDVSRCAPG